MNNNIKTGYNHPLNVCIGAKCKDFSRWITKGVYLQWCNIYKTIRTAFSKRPILSTILLTFILLLIWVPIACSLYNHYMGHCQLLGYDLNGMEYGFMLSSRDARKIQELFKKNRIEISQEKLDSLRKMEHGALEEKNRSPIVKFVYHKETLKKTFINELYILWTRVPSFLQNNNITVALQSDFSGDDQGCFDLYKDVVVGWEGHKNYRIENPAMLALVKKLIDENLINENGWFKDTKSCDRAKTIIEEFINEQE